MLTLARSGDPFAGAPVPAPCYRIPALAVVGERIVAAYDVRTSPLDLPGPNGIALTISDDGSAWREPRWLRAPKGAWGCGDASLISVGEDLLCWYVGSAGTSFWEDQAPGGDWSLWLASSTDGGDSWTHRELSHELWPGDAGCLFASSGNGLRLSTGRLLQPMVLRRSGTQDRSVAMAISDDDGQVWRLGCPVPGCDETKVAELPDGTVVLHARATPSRLVAFSADGGESFTVPNPDLPDPGCNGGLTTLSDGRLACTLVHPDGEPGPAGAVALPDPTGGRGARSGPDWAARRNLVLRVGSPGRWGAAQVLDAGLAAYSVCVALPDGRVAVAWEYGAYEGIRFAVVQS